MAPLGTPHQRAQRLGPPALSGEEKLAQIDSAGSAGEGFAERRQALERLTLSPLAAPSYPALRARPEPDCSLRTPFQRDRDRIVHCKAFRRLKHKTQVFVAPLGDHYRTRLTHTIEVTAISRTVARALALNEDLTEAIGMGHDLGHPPFGHIGEEVLDECLRERFGGGFRHYEHSLRVVEELEPAPGEGGERAGGGLNLTEQVRNGIVNHSSRAPQPRTLEGRIVRVMDRVAYINHDIDDALRAGLLRDEDLPAGPIAVLGGSGSRRIDALVHDMVEHSARAGDIVQGERAAAAMRELRDFMFARVYLGPDVLAERARIAAVVRRLFEHYVEHPEQLPDGGGEGELDLARRVTDYIAGMTDRYCIRRYTELQVPRAFAR
ncbi:MAG TPA: deoxyguanosinetriphosphate triphosphohydrolase [Solirubrobacteraceae bacterium]|nr:deoxyguanosinetriphosphate triphosphohydrolase [Solirubrobacteraceae bacterium]